jgi:hypothetical protein
MEISTKCFRSLPASQHPKEVLNELFIGFIGNTQTRTS